MKSATEQEERRRGEETRRGQEKRGEEEEDEEDEEEDEEEATDIKSNNPHLAGGDKVENPNLKWMMNGGSPISGKLHMSQDPGTIDFLSIPRRHSC